MEQIVGRKTEITQLTEYFNSGKAEFVAVYGRRRVGKTFLVHNLFKDRFAFEMSGSIDAPTGLSCLTLAMRYVNLATPNSLYPRIGQRPLRH